MSDNILTRIPDINIMRKQGIIPAPHFADLHTSNLCQQKCRGCAYGDKHDGTMMAKEDHLKVMEDLYSMGVQAFDFAGGGEPLCIPYIMDIWQWCVDHKCAFGLITNGLGLNDENIAFLQDHATYVRVSLEAATSEGYARYKQSSTTVWFDVLKRVRQLTKPLPSQRCQVGIKFAVGKSLRGPGHYEMGQRLGHSLNVDNVQFKSLRHEPEELSREGKIEEANFLHSICKGDSLIRHWILPTKEEQVPQCDLNPLHVAVDHNGDIYLCCYYYYRGEEHRIGNMLDTPIIELWGTKEHASKIVSIDREQCKNVDCKFFRHHLLVEEATTRGRGLFL